MGADVGVEFHLTRERVRQIVLRETGQPLNPYRGTCVICGGQGNAQSLGHRNTPEHRWALVQRSMERKARTWDRNVARFWTRVDQSAGPDGCWLWTGKLLPTGHGETCFWRERYAHRFSWRIANGDIPVGLDITHASLTCPAHCVNPAHLVAMTTRDHILRLPTQAAAVNARKTQCMNGHSDWVHTASGRYCRTCTRERYDPVRSHERYLARKAATA